MPRGPFLALAASEVARNATLFVATLVVLLAALLVVGLVVLFRRRGASRPESAAAVLGQRAGIQLVRADDALAGATQELGFAQAQFGDDATRPFAETIAAARADVTEAFRLQHALQDPYPESVTRTREWTLQIIALTDRALRSLTEQERSFAELRRREADAPSAVESLRARSTEQERRLAAVRDAVSALRYAPALVAPASAAVAEAETQLAEARSSTDAASAGLGGRAPLTEHLDRAADALHRATVALDTAERIARELDSAAEAARTERTRAAADVAEARAVSAPDPETASEIAEAVAALDAELAKRPADPLDPFAELERFQVAGARLDAALASARNQRDRLEHARAALAGALVTARSQIGVAESVVRGSRDVRARSWLAEAERQLALAEAEADPVLALDAARRAATHARDAEALAR